MGAVRSAAPPAASRAGCNDLGNSGVERGDSLTALGKVKMLMYLFIAILVCAGATSAFAQQCLHGLSETPAERTRRQKAIEVAHP